MECCGKYRPESCAAKLCSPGLGYDAQPRRHNISDYTAIITGMATANSSDGVAKKKLYVNSFSPGNGADWAERVCASQI